MLATSSNPFDLFVSNQSSCGKFLSRASPSLADIYEEGTDFNFSCRKWNTSGIKKCLLWCPSLQVKGKEEEEEMRKVISQKRPQYILKRIYKQKYCSECFLLLQWTSPMLLSQDSFWKWGGVFQCSWYFLSRWYSGNHREMKLPLHAPFKHTGERRSCQWLLVP